jgi:hypothetical protein
MADTFRALCEELVDELEDWICCDDESEIADEHSLIDRARAALAQPEPPSLKEALKALERMQDLYPHLGNTKTIRRALEAQPEPVAPTDEELISPIMWMIDDCVYDNDKGEIAQSLRELIARWGTPNPITEEFK